MTDTPTDTPVPETTPDTTPDTPKNPPRKNAAGGAPTAAKRASGGLGGKVLAELQEIAAELGIEDVQGMRKGALIDAIKAARGEAQPQPKNEQPKNDQPKAEKKADQPKAEKKADEPKAEDKADEPKQDQPKQGKQNQNEGAKNDGAKNDGAKNDGSKNDGAKNEGGQQRGNRQNNQGNQNKQQNQPQQSSGKQNQNNQGNQNAQQHDDDDDEGGSGRRRNRRGRNRNRGMDAEPTYSEDDVLVPAAGILDILDNYAFVRTTGYLPSDQDVYVSLSMVRKWGLRRGDAITGQVRQPREGERKEKFNPMVKVETVNGMSLEESGKRVEFGDLTPVFPTERLHLEGEAGGLTGRLVDLVAPIGKGQRGLVVSPPKAGKTVVLQQIANAVTANNPECHLMVVLVDERPEEVTEFQRSVKGEVISSTFDRPASDHTTVAELAIERAKRLVELGHDVVVLLDGITRLGRAYNLAAPASGRVVSGGVDASALYPSKKFFGAARNVEDGGSLTIIATALVETGSHTDEAIFEEFEGTGNWELRLRRELAEKRIFPAIDVAASSTRREELLLDQAELDAVSKLRRAVADQELQQGVEQVLDRLKRTGTNAELLRQIDSAQG